MYEKNNIFKFLTAFILAICAFAFVAEARPAQSNPANDMQIMLIGGGGGIGTAALSQIIAAHPDSAIIIVNSDGDGTARLSCDAPLIANKFAGIPMATAERLLMPPEVEKPNQPPIATDHGNAVDYRTPANFRRYDGQRVNNLIRADTV